MTYSPVIPCLAFAFLANLLFFSGSALAKDALEGPIPATIERVIDGDTLEVLVHIWLGQEVRVAVRLAGVDAPERRARCEAEQALATAATAFLQRLEGNPVVLTHITRGKFAGRVLADVHHVDVGDLGAALIGEGMARVYDGGRRASWCPQPIALGQTIPDQ